MAIKNKDGTTYQLRAPNPMMKNQSHWDKTQLTLHNLKWHGVTIPDDTLVAPFESSFNKPSLPSSKDDEIVDPYINGPVLEIKTETIFQSPEAVAAEPVKKQETPHVPDNIPRVVCWCLPAIIREKRDDLYGETKRTIQYGEKFTFEAVVVNLEYAGFSFWTTIDKLTEGSVIFPQIEDRRWWRIMTVQPKTGGWLVSCVMSDYQRDFVR